MKYHSTTDNYMEEKPISKRVENLLKIDEALIL